MEDANDIYFEFHFSKLRTWYWSTGLASVSFYLIAAVAVSQLLVFPMTFILSVHICRMDYDITTYRFYSIDALASRVTAFLNSNRCNPSLADCSQLIIFRPLSRSRMKVGILNTIAHVVLITIYRTSTYMYEYVLPTTRHPLLTEERVSTATRLCRSIR